MQEMMIKTFSMKTTSLKNTKTRIKNKIRKTLIKIQLNNKFIMLPEKLMTKLKKKSKDPK